MRKVRFPFVPKGLLPLNWLKFDSEIKQIGWPGVKEGGLLGKQVTSEEQARPSYSFSKSE